MKAKIDYLMGLYVKLGHFMEKSIAVPTGKGSFVEVKNLVRSALDQEFIDIYGMPNDELANVTISQAKLMIARQLYIYTESELEARELFDNKIHWVEKEDYWNCHERLYAWCIAKLRFMRIIAPADSFKESELYDSDGDVIGLRQEKSDH